MGYILSIEKLVATYVVGNLVNYDTETDTFTSTVTEEIFKIRNRFDCNDKFLVYLVASISVKNNTLAKLQKIFVGDGTTAILKEKVVIGENSIC